MCMSILIIPSVHPCIHILFQYYSVTPYIAARPEGPHPLSTRRVRKNRLSSSPSFPATMVSSPSSPAPYVPRPPPKRTYGKRGARLFKSRPVTPEIASETDVDSEDERPGTTPKASTSNGGAKRARLARGDTNSPRASQGTSQPNVTLQQPSTVYDSDDALSRTPRPLARTHSDLLAESPRASAPASPIASSSQTRNGGSIRQGSMPPRPPRRRMLSRAESMHTYSQLNMPASAPTTPRPLRTAHSMPVTPGSERSLLNALNESPGSVPGSPTVMTLVPVAMGSPSPAKAKRTYGGNRSFLAQHATDLDTALSEDAQPSYSELRKAYEVDNGDDDTIRNLAEEFNLARAPESINDMRSKGENRLFMDDIGVLLGDINNPGQSLALRRSRWVIVWRSSADGSALDVLQKMQEGEWMARLRGHTESVFADLCSAKGDDAILGAACLLFLALLAKGEGLRKLLEGEVPNVTAVLRSHIDLTSGPLDQAYKGKVSLSVSRDLYDIADRRSKDSAPSRPRSSTTSHWEGAGALRLTSWPRHVRIRTQCRSSRTP